MKRAFILLGVFAVATLGVVFRPYLHAAISPLLQKLRKQPTISQRIERYGEAARARWKPHFTRAGVPYPPAQATLLGLKAERVLHIYAADADGDNRWIRSYKILAASGEAGPKLREGDRQVPEGVYPVESLNPNSRFHLSLRLGYPNAFDREQAAREGRTRLGGDIMIHGSSVSVGCLAMGDEAAEDLFVLAAETGLPNLTVIIAPHDFRVRNDAPQSDRLPPWADPLYEPLKARLSKLPSTPAPRR